ncbi:MAG: hypothetical protein IPK17_32310 [Chloroflexi bacterium]|uniref:hypothetical protein n=1 Tax=Candidatus Flexifilum breve TaxID=3140694 RepID=UPI0031361063|nr:hypothetical protein [Chloroflexota bacterium]
MATLVKPSSPQRSLRRLLQRVRSYYAHGEITALVIAVLLLLMPALSLNSAAGCSICARCCPSRR